MRQLIDIARRLVTDERGVFLPMFGILAIVLIATAGAVVDYTSVEQARTRAQVALDAAALALQPRIYTDSNDTLKTKAGALLVERLNDPSITASMLAAVKNTTDGSLTLTARLTVPMSFVSLVGINTLSAQILSESTRKMLNLEVAMVLDNSGSMGSYSRMTNLKTAAKNATDIMFNYSDTTPNVWVGVVPFTEFVNVGTANKTATWMDGAGNAAISKHNFDSDDNDATAMSTAVNRFTLYDNIGVTWRGCVEARQHITGAGGLYYDTSDIAPDTSIKASLFTPLFAPDNPDTSGEGYENNYLNDRPSACTGKDLATWTWVQTKYSCNKSGSSQSNYDSATCDGASPTNTYTQKNSTGATVSPAATTQPTSGTTNNNNDASCSDDYETVSGSGSNRTIRRTRTCTYKFTDRELQERICKYASGNSVSSSKDGPNSDCGTVALLDLSNNRTTVKNKITAMVASGGTGIHQGVMWGFHMLSPTEPLTSAKAYDDTTSKVMIVMTDGENTHSYNSNMNGADWYVAYGYPYNGRLTGGSTTALQTEMDNRTKSTCTNAKNAGIIIYTIGLSSPNTTTTNMLTNCASDSSKAYFPTDPAALTTVFEDIANQLSALRLAQ